MMNQGIFGGMDNEGAEGEPMMGQGMSPMGMSSMMGQQSQSPFSLILVTPTDASKLPPETTSLLLQVLMGGRM